MPAKKKLTKKDRQYFKKKLLVMREKIVGSLQHLEKESLNKSLKDAAGDLSSYSFHMADVATDNFDTEIHFGLASNTQMLLNEIDDALQRIEDGTYGICERYEVPIPKKRLEVMPHARYCIKAQEEIEKEKRQEM